MDSGKILHTVTAARNPVTPPARAEIKLRNVNMFLNGLVSDRSVCFLCVCNRADAPQGLDASMIE
jgi:hypothetical protein